jgi:hypothetical protein
MKVDEGHYSLTKFQTFQSSAKDLIDESKLRVNIFICAESTEPSFLLFTFKDLERER